MCIYIMENDLSILPVKPMEEENRARRDIHPNLPDINKGSLLLLVSPVRTGKSTILSNLLLNPNFMRDAFDIVYIISNTIHNDDTSRFLKEQLPETIWDNYSDEIIQNIINYQKTFPKKKMPKIAIILDDFLGIKQNSMIYFLASRFRHYNIGLLCMATQLLRGVPTVIRQNATHAIFGSPNPNSQEMEKICEEFGSLYEGKDNFLALYNQAAQKRFDFLYLDLHNNPTRAFRNFGEQIYQGKSNEERNDAMTLDE